jgi:hypothetical protein
MQLFAFPLGVAACVVVAAAWFFLTPIPELKFDSPGFLLGAFLIIIPIHELIHAMVHPGSGGTADSILGFWPSRLLFYAHYMGELTRTRFIAILLMPLLIISFLPLVICAITGYTSALLVFSSVINAFFACGDIFAIGLLLFQIPARARVRNQGWRTYWRDY